MQAVSDPRDVGFLGDLWGFLRSTRKWCLLPIPAGACNVLDHSFRHRPCALRVYAVLVLTHRSSMRLAAASGRSIIREVSMSHFGVEGHQRIPHQPPIPNLKHAAESI